MKHAFFIRTYLGDVEWLPYCLQSLNKWEPEIPIFVVAPPKGFSLIRTIAEGFGVTCTEVYPVHADGYVDQQWSKLHADIYCPAEFITHIDSDCQLVAPLANSFRDGKPIMLKTPWEHLSDDARVWREITKSYLGFTPAHEFMRRNGLTYPRELYAYLRAYLASTMGNMDEWFPAIKDRRMSEFNLLGAYAHQHWYDEFYWIDTSKETFPESIVNQAWSWGGLDKVKPLWETLLASPK
jgi:hypothetical protein